MGADVVVTGDGEQGGEGGGGEAVSPDKLLSAFTDFQTSIGSRFDQLEQRIPAPVVEEDDEDDDDIVLPEYGDDDLDDDGQVSQVAQMRELQRVVDRAVERARAPELEQRKAQHRVAYSNKLEETYPELQDAKVQDQTISETLAFCERIGRPELAQEPEVLEQIFLGMKGRGVFGDAGAGSEQEVHLERQGAATPRGGGKSTADEAGDAIVAISQGRYRLGSG